MAKKVCCSQNPILLNGSLVFVCNHAIPRRLKYEDGIIVQKHGHVVLFSDLRTIGSQHTDRFGVLANYECGEVR